MKRSGTPLSEPRSTRNKSLYSPTDEGELPYRLQMLQNWEMAPEAARFLEISDGIESSRVSDCTCPQLCLRVYTPNPHQSFIDSLPGREAMEVE